MVRAALAGAAAAALVLAGGVPAGALAPPAGPRGTAVSGAPPAAVCSYPDEDLPVVVPGDLHAVGLCRLNYAVVLGDVHVAPGTHLSLWFGRVAGDVHVGRAGRLSLYRQDVAGGLQLDGAEAVWITGSTVGRSVRGKVAALELEMARVSGAVNVAAPEAATTTGTKVFASEIGGWVNLHGGVQRIGRSTLHRGLTMSWARDLALCETSVAADVTVRHTRGPAHVGGRFAPVWSVCEPGTDDLRNGLGSALLLLDNRATVRLDGTDVAGDLECLGGSAPPQVAADVTVGGARVGQCA
ncbi:hypothetical protein AB6N23_11720 [Cellulomonas sp. 179-A 9B4 NHS]|uniref:hypothetical protein n=1 Tax=Cellulomonas sp. 179-A 9B4 NHS TaxID=3142379 RepID=UPI0039A3C7DF